MSIAASTTPITDAEQAIMFVARAVALAPPSERIHALTDEARHLGQFVIEGWINPAVASDRIFEVAELHGLGREPDSYEAGQIAFAARLAAGARHREGADSIERPADHLEFDQAPPPLNLSLINPPQWRDIPLEPMCWLASHRIPAREPTILGGDGGGGKTTVALQLAVAVAHGLGDWLGTVTESGPVIFFSAEEPENEMRRRLDRVARKRGIAPADIDRLHFHFADPDRCLLGVARPNGAIIPTDLFEALCRSANEIRPALVIVDSIAAVFGGNQNDRVQVRTFVSLFRRLARDANCAALLLDHPSLSGMTNGTGRAGSMDWNNAVRARLHLRSVDSDDGTGKGRELEVMKSNYGPAGEKVLLRWEDGCFVMEASAVGGPRLAAAYQSADQAYLDCLDACSAQGINVFALPGRGYAPKVFAEMPEAKGSSMKALVAAQARLLHTGKIENVPFGPPSRGTKRVGRKQDGASK